MLSARVYRCAVTRSARDLMCASSDVEGKEAHRSQDHRQKQDEVAIDPRSTRKDAKRASSSQLTCCEFWKG